MMIRPIESSHSFRFPTPTKLADVYKVLAWLFERHNANPDYLIVSPEDFRELKEEIADVTPSFVILYILNPATPGRVRVVPSSMMQPGMATFGKLYFENATLYPEKTAQAVAFNAPLMIDPGA